MRIFRELNQLPKFKNAVLTIGSFDGVHSGHQKILQRVSQIAANHDGESVLITFHPHPRFVLAPDSTRLRLLSTIDEKIDLLKKYNIDNLVIVPFDASFYEQSPEDYILDFLVEKFQPHTIVIGYDHKFGKDRAGNIQLLQQFSKEKGFNIEQIQKQEIEDIAVSSTKVRKALEAGEVKKAAKLLQHPFSINGKVVHGERIGHTIGFPTANLDLGDPHKLIPPIGIYAVWVFHKGQKYGGMLYIGNRPTIKDHNNKISIEVNLFEFSGDLYDKNLKVDFVEHIREDVSFAGLDALRLQLAKDEISARKILGLEKKKSTDAAVAVVILNYNGVDHLQTFLPSVLKTTYAGAKIWVADNGSTDESLAILKNKFPEVNLIEMPINLGFTGGYNSALEKIDSPYTVLLNSDVEVTPDWLEPLMEQMEKDPSIGICQPKILAYKSKESFEYAGAAGGIIDDLGYPLCRGRVFDTVEVDKGQYDQAAEVSWASGCALLIRTELYKKLGGLDADYFAHMEEIDLCWRIKRAGYKVMAFPESTVYHLGGGTLNYQNPRKTFLNFRNSLYTLYKNESKSTYLWKTLMRLILDAPAALRFLLLGQWKDLWAIIKSHWSFFSQIPRLHRKRKRDQDLIEKIRIGPSRVEKGRYKGSIIWAYFAKGKRTFDQL